MVSSPLRFRAVLYAKQLGFLLPLLGTSLMALNPLVVVNSSAQVRAAL